MSESVRKTRRWGRIAAVVVVFMLIGAAVNVLVAWGACVEARDPRGFIVIRGETRASGWSLPYGRSWGAPDLAERRDLWGRTHHSATWLGRVDAGGHGTRMRKDIAATTAGFPFHGLALVTEIEQVDNFEPAAFTRRVHHVWKLDTPAYFGDIPLRPLWPGFALNTLIYAVLAWGFWQIPLMARRRRRRKRNQCLACGYSRAGLAEGSACPECGSPRF